MHLGSETSRSKSEAMFFPNSLMQARFNYENDILPSDLHLPNNKKVHFVKNFKYLGSVITLLLNEDAEIDIRIKKAKSIMGASKHFLTTKTSAKKLRPKSISLDPSTLYYGDAKRGTSRNATKKKS